MPVTSAAMNHVTPTMAISEPPGRPVRGSIPPTLLLNGSTSRYPMVSRTIHSRTTCSMCASETVAASASPRAGTMAPLSVIYSGVTGGSFGARCGPGRADAVAGGPSCGLVRAVPFADTKNGTGTGRRRGCRGPTRIEAASRSVLPADGASINPGRTKKVRDGGGADLVAVSGEFAVDAAAPEAGFSVGQTHVQGADLDGERRGLGWSIADEESASSQCMIGLPGLASGCASRLT